MYGALTPRGRELSDDGIRKVAEKFHCSPYLARPIRSEYEARFEIAVRNLKRLLNRLYGPL